jgi:hypothetical protein
MNISIVIPLGHGSRWNNTELRYCLRSIEKHLTGYGEIFIIGERPEWLHNIIHIPAIDSDKTYHKERNIFNKIRLAILDERVTEDFLFVNDDHFLLKDYDAGAFPYYYYCRLSNYMTVTDYKHTVRNTKMWLNYDPFYADIHCPIIYNKEKFQSVFEAVAWPHFGYCIKTAYCHFHQSTMIEQSDLKLNEQLPCTKIKDLIAGRPWFSMGDAARGPELLKVLRELYPNPSKYEKRYEKPHLNRF